MNAPETTGKAFPTPDVVSAVTGFLLCDIGGVYEVLSYLVGRSLYTHELPAAMAETKRSAVLPAWLDGLDCTGIGHENWQAWRDRLVAEHGPTVTLTPITYSPLAERSPLETAVEMFGAERVVVVET